MKYLYLICFLFSLNSVSQTTNKEALAYNIGLGSIVGGIGSVINKEENEKWHKVFLKGLWQGALGGYFVYEGKKKIYKFSETQNYKDAWASKLLFSTGNSVIQNAASNRDFWSKFILTIGFNRVEIETQNNFKVNYQVSPLSLVSTIHYSTVGKFNIEETLKTGTFIFTKFDSFNKSDIKGEALWNNIFIVDKRDYFKTLSHEIIHIYQNQEFQYFNSLLIGPKEKLIQNKLLRSLDDYIYFDFHLLAYLNLYNLQNNENCHYNNLFEQEANFYSFQNKCN